MSGCSAANSDWGTKNDINNKNDDGGDDVERSQHHRHDDHRHAADASGLRAPDLPPRGELAGPDGVAREVAVVKAQQLGLCDLPKPLPVALLDTRRCPLGPRVSRPGRRFPASSECRAPDAGRCASSRPTRRRRSVAPGLTPQVIKMSGRLTSRMLIPRMDMWNYHETSVESYRVQR